MIPQLCPDILIRDSEVRGEEPSIFSRFKAFISSGFPPLGKICQIEYNPMMNFRMEDKILKREE